MKFQNISTGEVMEVFNVSNLQGRIFFTVRGKGCGSRFLNRNTCLVLDEQVENGTFLKVAEGWQLVEDEKSAKERKPRTPKVAKVDEPEVEGVEVHSPQQRSEIESVESVPAPEPKVPESMANEILAELRAKYGTMGEDIFESACALAGIIPSEQRLDAEQVEAICAKWFAKNKPSGGVSVSQIEVKSPAGVNVVSGSVNKDFEVFCNIVNAGKPLYMYGPAGSGKSYTAHQIAGALGLDYYETSQAMFAHELKGYGDAKGEFVPTAFYRAFSGGGVFFLDEVDASAPEALVVLNNAIANKRFDFPVIGNIEAHPNFRVVAAGNTRMTGATIEYTARQMQDTSFKNRFFFATVSYDRDVFIQICGGDEDIVNFGEDLRRAARETGISQLFSYRQGQDLATLQACCKNDDAYLLRGSVLQEKEVDDVYNLYSHLQNKDNRWARAMKKCYQQMQSEEVW